MKIIATLLLPIVFMLTACSGSSSTDRNAKPVSRLLEDPEHHIKDSPEITKFDSTILYTGWYYVVNTDNGYKRQLDKSTETYFINRQPIVTASNFTTLEIYESDASGTKSVGLTIRLDKQGTENWSIATEKSIGKQLAFVLDNRLLYVAKVNAQITGGIAALNRGSYTQQELQNFKTIIESER